MELRHSESFWLLGRTSPLSVGNKHLLYKSLITPLWTYGFGLWGCSSKSNNALIQRCLSKILRAIFDAPWYVNNAVIDEDLGIPAVQEVIHARSVKHIMKLETHSNHLPRPIPRDNVVQKLKRRWPSDL